MDEPTMQRPRAAWYMPAAIASLLFMALGCVAYLMTVLTDSASLTVEERTLHDALPTWVVGAQAVAVWIGLAGALMLVLKKKLAELLLLVSLVAVVVWLAGLLLVTGVRENMSANDLIVAVVVTAVTWTIFWFARQSRQRGWLR